MRRRHDIVPSLIPTFALPLGAYAVRPQQSEKAEMNRTSFAYVGENAATNDEVPRRQWLEQRQLTEAA